MPFRTGLWSSLLELFGFSASQRPHSWSETAEQHAWHRENSGAIAPDPLSERELPKREYLFGTVYSCSACRAHLGSPDAVISKAFHGRGGRAFLLEECVNVSAGEPQERLLITGLLLDACALSQDTLILAAVLDSFTKLAC
jgi:hypothetical protein